MVELEDTDRAQDPYVPHAFGGGGVGEAVPQSGLDPLDLPCPVLGQQQVQRRVGHRGGQRVAHEGRPVREHRHLAPGDPVRHGRRAQGRRHGQVAAGQGLADTHHIRSDVRVSGGEQRSRTAETGGDLVEDQQDAVLVARLAEHPQVAGGVEDHAARPLDHRLHDDRRQFTGVPRDQLTQVRLVRGVRRRVEPRRRRVREQLPGQRALPELVHPAVRVAHRHRLPGVAVVAAAPGHQPLFARLSDRAPVLEAHLHGHLDRHRTGVGEEDVLQAVRGDLRQPGGEPDGGLVGEPAEHHMAHPVQLAAGGLVEHRVVVSVHRRPPGRHSVDQFGPAFDRFGQSQSYAGRRRDDQRIVPAGHRAVRVPDVLPVQRQQFRDGELRGLRHSAAAPYRRRDGVRRRGRYGPHRTGRRQRRGR